jgi:RHS repeat-associated protein
MKWATTLESYSMLGLDTIVKRAHPQSTYDQTFVKYSTESNGDAGDQYIGLDRFGRVVDQRWMVSSTGTTNDRYQYGFDRDGNVLYRSNLSNHSMDELNHANGSSNGYDSLGQMTAFLRGTLSDTNSDGVPDTVASNSRSQSWSFDAVGNWSSVTTNGTAQNRTANQQNQITSITSLTTPVYDADGHMTTDQSGKTLVYDAWGRPVAYKNGATTLESMAYDALGRKIVENAGTSHDLYFSQAWQILEEDWSGAARIQNVWSAAGIDIYVERDRDADGSSGNGLEERLYVEQDANGNVTALVDTSGTVQERYQYDPYGAVTILTAAWGARGSSSFAFTNFFQGARYDSTTGLFNFRNREYSPTLGRWIQNDPLGYAAGDSNTYRALGNAPAGVRDPLGLRAEMASGDDNAMQSCFPAGTLVSTETGLRPIQEIAVGDQVWAFDHVSEEWKLRGVLKCYESLHQGELVALTVSGEVIEATPGHPFWVIEGEGLLSRPIPEHCPKSPANSRVPGQWVDAGYLQIGDRVLLKRGRSSTITDSKRRFAEESVFNIQVAELHSYVVGESQVLVHNSSALLNNPSGVDDAAASKLVDAILNGTSPLSELKALSPQQLENELAIIRRAVTTPLGKYPKDLISEFNAARLNYLNGKGPRPGSLLEYAQKWIEKQSPEWLSDNSDLVNKLANQGEKARELTARRASEAAARAAAEEAGQNQGAKLSSKLSNILRTGAPFAGSVAAVLLDPTPTASGGIKMNQLMYPVHSPEFYYLPKGTYITPNGQIFVPGPNSTFVPPPGSVRVTGKVAAQSVLFQLQQTLASGQVAPIP